MTLARHVLVKVDNVDKTGKVGKATAAVRTILVVRLNDATLTIELVALSARSRGFDANLQSSLFVVSSLKCGIAARATARTR